MKKVMGITSDRSMETSSPVRVYGSEMFCHRIIDKANETTVWLDNGQ